ncbi:MAG TPA: amidohydrolase [Longimicrobiales bacterium]|nr:amidohydrolase [Longimicrobiales bacterium]
MLRRILATFLIAVLAGCQGMPGYEHMPWHEERVWPADPADMVLLDGRVFLADAAQTEHEAIAIRGNRVLAVGASEWIATMIGPRTRVVELGGRLVTPGFNDTHMHLASGGVSMLEVVLQGATSLEEVGARVRAAAAEAAPGEWITGRGWDQTRMRPEALGTGGWPTKEVLDLAAPDNPVYLRRVDGHVAWVNTRALELANIDRTLPHPAGGEIVRDARGDATGILKESAMNLVGRILPPPDAAKLRRGIEAAMAVAARSGVTSVQTQVEAEDLVVYRRMRDAGELTLRVYGWDSLSARNIARLRADDVIAATGDEWLRVGMLKGFTDGTLGSRTAWMLEPYSDVPSTRGIQRLTYDQLVELVVDADAAGLQVALHAIGDGGNRMALDAYERALVVNGARDSRHRIEHAQILDASDIPRFAGLGIVASMQPTHATSDMRWAEERIGTRRAREGAYAWRSLLDAGAVVSFGTDFGVEPMEPVQGLYSAVTRQSREEPGTPPGGWLPEQRLTIAEAIRAYTAIPAWVEFQEQHKGTLERGMLADLVVWDRDLLSVDPGAILEAEPVLTVVDGRVVFETVAAGRTVGANWRPAGDGGD